MVHQNNVWKISGKKASLLVPISIFVAIITLIGLIALVFIKADQFEKALGDRQLELFTVYQTGEKYLHLVDNAAGIAVKAALLKVAETGLKKSSPCGNYVDNGKAYAIWAVQGLDAACQPESVPVPCYPDPDTQEAKVYLADTFKPEFEQIIKDFNAKKGIAGGFSENIPEEYEKFYIGNGVKPTIIGIAKNPIVLERVSVKKPYPIAIRYKIKPSFNEPVEVNFLEDSTNLISEAQKLVGKPKDEVTALVKAADGQNSLDWDENFAYSTSEQAPCSYQSGSCSCCETVETCEEYEFGEMGNPVLDENGEQVCKKKGSSEVPVDDGTEYARVPYDIISTPMSVKVNDPDSGTGHKQLFVYDADAKKVVPKELEYRFALNWAETHPDKAKTCCSCGAGHPCGGDAC